MVEQLLVEPNTGYSIICNDLKKVYPGKDGNPNKFAVRGLSLALPNGECFGLLGPNGAGKTSFINMVCSYIFNFLYKKIAQVFFAYFNHIRFATRCSALRIVTPSYSEALM